jgi:molybdenum cofactor cytidylyltransferase
MLESFRPGKQQIIVSKSVSGWEGVPVLFDRCYFDELLNLSGKEGAKKIIKKHINALKYEELGDLMEDMDTPEAYHRLLKKFMSRG